MLFFVSFFIAFFSNFAYSCVDSPPEFLSTNSYHAKDSSKVSLFCLENKKVDIPVRVPLEYGYTIQHDYSFLDKDYVFEYAEGTALAVNDVLKLDIDSLNSSPVGSRCLYELIDKTSSFKYDSRIKQNVYTSNYKIDSLGESCPDDSPIANSFFLNSDFSGEKCWDTDLEPLNRGNGDFVLLSKFLDAISSLPDFYFQTKEFSYSPGQITGTLHPRDHKPWSTCQPPVSISSRTRVYYDAEKPLIYRFKGGGNFTLVIKDSLSSTFNLELVNYILNIYAGRFFAFGFQVPYTSKRDELAVNRCFQAFSHASKMSKKVLAPAVFQTDYYHFQLSLEGFNGCGSSINSSFLVDEINSIKESNLISFENIKETINGIEIDLTQTDLNSLSGLSFTSFESLMSSDFSGLVSPDSSSSSSSSSDSEFDLDSSLGETFSLTDSLVYSDVDSSDDIEFDFIEKLKETPLFSSFLNISLNSSSSCYPFVFQIPFFSKTFELNFHCSIYSQFGRTLSAIFILVWSLIAFKIILSSRSKKKESLLDDDADDEFDDFSLTNEFK